MFTPDSIRSQELIVGAENPAASYIWAAIRKLTEWKGRNYRTGCMWGSHWAYPGSFSVCLTESEHKMETLISLMWHGIQVASIAEMNLVWSILCAHTWLWYANLTFSSLSRNVKVHSLNVTAISHVFKQTRYHLKLYLTTFRFNFLAG
jgi:hypothetical protein